MALPPLLEVAVERSYLDPKVAARIADEAERTKTPPERLLIARQHLSPRRIERLQAHVRYKELRRTDKMYARLAVKQRMVSEADATAALAEQKVRFERDRDQVRLGALLVERGHLTNDGDRQLRSKLARASAAEAVSEVGSNQGQSTAVRLEESSCARSPVPTYDAIDRVMDKVSALKKLQEDLSRSESPGNPPAGPDSAAEFENAVRMLARARMGIEASPTSSTASTSKSTKKTTGERRALKIA